MEHIKRKTVANIKYNSYSDDENIFKKMSTLSSKKGLDNITSKRKNINLDMNGKNAIFSQNSIKLKIPFEKRENDITHKGKGKNKIRFAQSTEYEKMPIIKKKGNIERDVHDNVRKGKSNIFYYKKSVSSSSIENEYNDDDEDEDDDEEDVDDDEEDVDDDEEDVDDDEEDVDDDEEDVDDDEEDVDDDEEDVDDDEEDVNEDDIDDDHYNDPPLNNDDNKKQFNTPKKVYIQDDMKSCLNHKKSKTLNKTEYSFQRMNTNNAMKNNYKYMKSTLKKNFTLNIDKIKENNPKKSVSMRIDKNIIYSKTPSYNKNGKENMIKAKSQILKIAEQYMSTDKIKAFKTIERGNTRFLNKNKKIDPDKIQNLGPFVPKMIIEKKTERKLGYIPNYIRKEKKKEHTSDNANILFSKDKDNKITIQKKKKKNDGFGLFENMLVLNNLGKIYEWDGYQMNKIKNLYEQFICICTNKKGNLLCIDLNYKPGYLLCNRHFNRMDHNTQSSLFKKIVISIKNKIWGIDIQGNLKRWNKYEWIEVKKAYGIFKLKSLAFDRKNRLWVLDEQNYFFIYDTEDKNWMLKNVNGCNINDFDFNDNDNLTAVTKDGIIKIYKKNRWIKYGILGEVKIRSLHFIR
ncbi:conserved Plasmodium protein, unknown function [Plasmodium gaboni]|uniref:Thioredoxin-like associated protein 2 n=1 Tax=Plasmodium gaboni TaxID=647221 RepID=A0ABY1UJV2_9APIC|nr:conserved Plasmodium protein, unknown function [Plasmodium gaboni]